ncbi:MAG TPA: hypothetical protein EYP20_03750 [Aigarchaeota archaeon]|nr:hypothetical protein [Aigarchaeota archaeon]
MVTVHEIPPQMRPTLLECMNKLKEIIILFRKFLDTEDYSYVEEAYRLNQEVKNNPEFLKFMSGYADLDNNIQAMYNMVKERGGDVDSLTHGKLSNQAVYIITRANIIYTGLEFRMKRMRKG